MVGHWWRGPWLRVLGPKPIMEALDTDVVAPAPTGAMPLWQRWQAERSADCRAALFLHYSSWMRTLAAGLMRTYRYPLAEWNDYLHCAAIGLLSAIDAYELDRNTPFEAYAFHRIKGATLNGLTCYISEAKKNTELDEAAIEFASRLDDSYEEHEDPLVNVIDAVVGLALGRFLELGVRVNDDDVENGPHHYYEDQSSTSLLNDLLAELPEREQYVISAHYLNQMSFKEIAESMAISQPRVTQLHHQALRRLRQLYEAIA